MVQLWSESSSQLNVFILLQFIVVAVILSSLHHTENADVLTIVILAMGSLLSMFLWIWIISKCCHGQKNKLAWVLVILIPLVTLVVAEFVLIL